jgi:uncharacterized iron-regulated membrane protein
MSKVAQHSELYRRIWRWHFFAGLFVVPFAVILAVTGAIYLFANEIENRIDNHIFTRAAPTNIILHADELIERAISADDGSQLVRYIVPAEGDPAARVRIRTETGQRLLWVDRSTGEVLHDTKVQSRFLSTVARIHSTVLAGDLGNRAVELAASLMIILIITGAWLHWPRGRSFVSALIPQFSVSGRTFWKSLHGSVGMIAGVVILSLLITGLPWTGVWGKQFSKARDVMGWTGQQVSTPLESSPRPDQISAQGDGLKLWSTDGDDGEVTVTSISESGSATPKSAAWIIEAVADENLVPPVWVLPPRGDNGVWSVRSMPNIRHQRQTIHFDQWTGEEIMRVGFADYHPVEKAMGHGLSFHEGALFGVWNQILGVLAALSVLTLSIAGTIAWLKRRPKGTVAAPALPDAPKRLPIGLVAIAISLLAFLPVAGVTVAAIWVLDKLVSLVRPKSIIPGE